MKRKPSLLPLSLLILFFLILMVSFYSKPANTDTLTYSEMVTLFQTEQVKSFVVDDGTVVMELRAPYEGKSTVRHDLYSFNVFYNDLGGLIQQQYQDGILTSYDYPQGYEMPFWLSFVPYLLILVLFFVVWFVLMNRSGGGGNSVMKFSKARTHTGLETANKVTFDDVAGADEEKVELEEIVEFLKEPQKFIDLGARIPKGVLLVGPPGTGKTLLAKAVAGEAGVQFLSISGSDFVELYVGVGASRVRDLFDQAKKVAPAIVFIDEIDAVGRRRGAGLGGGHDEREQTLNQLLVEMDGFSNNEGVIVLAATNRQDILDPALLRPGRFDRQIFVGAPDTRGREAILKVHARNKPLADNVNLHNVAAATAGFTGADLSNLLNEAALLAARENRRAITMADLEQAMLRVIAGPEKKSRVVSQHERKLTAIHEAGHAVVMHYLPTHDPVHQITIVPRGGAGGMTISLPAEDRSFLSRNEMFEQIVSFLGGRVAEQLFLDDISTGASNDIDRASALAREMVSRYGMSEKLGTVSYGSTSEVFIGRDYEKTKSYSEKVAGSIDDEVKALIDLAYEKCKTILQEHAQQLQQVAAFLLEHETMSRQQFEAVMNGQTPAVSHAPAFEIPQPPAASDTEEGSETP